MNYRTSAFRAGILKFPSVILPIFMLGVFSGCLPKIKVNGPTSDPAQDAGTQNHAPIAVAQTLNVDDNATLAITLAGTDEDSDTLSYTVTSGGADATHTAHGLFSGAAPSITYTPNNGYIGADSFTFKVNDGHVDSLPATVSITIAAALSELSISSARTAITTANTSDYIISGGTPPYSVSTNLGLLSNATGSGTFNSDLYTGTATVSVSDALGASTQTNISIADRLTAGAPALGSNLLERNAHSTIAISGKLYIFGGNRSGNLNDTWVFDPARGAQGSWTQITPSGTPPSARSLHSAVAISGKMYVFGGADNGGNLTDTWVFDPANGAQGSWLQLTPSGTPPSTRRSSAVAISGKMYVFGGYSDSSGYLNALSVFDPTAGAQGSWTLLTPSGTPPIARYGHSAVTIAGKMYVFGGSNASGNLNDLYRLDPTEGAQGSWTLLTPSGTPPIARYAHSAVTISGKMYVFGGGGVGGYRNDLHLFDPAAGTQGSWTLLTPSGTPPIARIDHSAVALSGRMYVFGGSGTNMLSDTWIFDPASGAQGAWAQLSPSGSAPSSRFGHAAVPISEKMYVFGGYNNGRILNDTWVFDPAAGTSGIWTQLSPSGSAPSTRYMHSAVAIAGKMYVFGGNNLSNGSWINFNDTWVFDPANGAQGAWAQLAPTGSAPTPRYMHSAAAIAGKIYIFGGYRNGVYLNDTWIFNPTDGAQGSWTQLAPSGTPPSVRYQHSAVTISGKMYVFGGYDNSTLFNDIWVFNPADGAQGSWTSLAPSGRIPSLRLAHSAVNISGKMYVFGGCSNCNPFNDIWLFDPADGAQGSWTPLAPSGTAPSARAGHSAVTISGKMFFFGGNNSGGPLNDTWVFDPSNGSAGSWSPANYLRLNSNYSVSINDSFAFEISGGVEPFSVSAAQGTLSSNTGAATYTAPATPGSDTITVTDALGNTSTISVNIQGALNLTIRGTTLGHITSSSTLGYTVTGGIPPYAVSVDKGAIDTADGSGIFSANGDTGSAMIAVRDSQSNLAQVTITLSTSDLAIVPAQNLSTIGVGLPYTVSGGTAPYVVARDQGSISSATGSGTFTPATEGFATLEVADNAGNHAARVVRVYQPLAINVASPSIDYGDSTQYTISGGSGTYSVSADLYLVDNTAGSGAYTANGWLPNDTIRVSDNITGESTSVQITITIPPLAITVSHANLMYGDTTAYTVSGGTGDYSIYYDWGSIDNPSDSGTYTASSGRTHDTLYLYDNNNTNDEATVELTIAFEPLALEVASSLNGGDSIAYTVSGGTGSYSIWVNTGTVSNEEGSGTYTAGAFGGSADMSVSDNVSGDYLQRSITIHGPVQIVVTPEALAPSGTANYSVVNATAWPYSFSISGGGTINNPSTWGTFTAPNTPGISTLSVTDSVGNTGSAEINISNSAGNWLKIPGFTSRFCHSAVEISGKMYVFGGGNSSGENLNDTWVFDPAANSAQGSWTQLTPSGSAPPARQGHSAVLILGKMYVFGGYVDGSHDLNDTWVLDPTNGAQGSWAQLSPSGTAPHSRYSHAAGMISNTMYIFGGSSRSGGNLVDTWAFNPAANGAQGSWAQLSPSGSLSMGKWRSSATVLNKIYIFESNGGQIETYAFDPAANGAQGSLVLLSPSGTRPATRNNQTTVNISGKIYIFGGYKSGGNPTDTSVFDPAANGAQGSWAQLSPSGTTPSGRYAHSAAVISSKMYIFGGITDTATLNETWVFDSVANAAQGNWAQLSPSGTTPTPRYGATAVTIASKMYVFGGDSGSARLNDLWAFDSAVGTSGTWSQITPSGSAPSVRRLHSAVTISGKMYILGGIGNSDYRNDLWVFNPTAGASGSWSELTPSGSPPSERFSHSAVVISDKMYVFGGTSTSGRVNDLWVFDPTDGSSGSWTQLTPSGSAPSQRNGHAAVIISDKMYVFGGYSNSSRLNDLWVFNPAAGNSGSWSELTPSGSAPSLRDSHSAVVILGKMYIFGGDTAPSSIVFSYNPAAGSQGDWLAEPASGDIPIYSQYQHSVTVISNKMYIFGGQMPLNGDVYQYTPAP